MTERISVDALLELQSAQRFVATIEPVEDEPDILKITPWVRGMGCLCQLALKLRRDVVEAVTPTGDIHYCCGKSLRVVEIHFAEDSSISLDELFSQIMQSAQGEPKGQGGGVLPSGAPPHPFEGGGAADFSAMSAAEGGFYAPPMHQHAPPYPPPMPTQDVSFGAGEAPYDYASMLAASGAPQGGQAGAATTGTRAAIWCPPGYTQVYCGGRWQCVPLGSYCCNGQTICPSNQSCLSCGGRFQCAAQGEYCCGGQVKCPYYTSCISCGGRFQCAPQGYYCCNGQVLCPSDKTCTYCGGYFQCAAYGSYCCGGQVLCPPGKRCVRTSVGYTCQ